ncbi:phosphoglucosamine mutase [Pyrolobus fumarii]|uniref:phosphoglucosamine mutase n=1 Tax=Pyrolobus fumarii TaxID=54252 RepID=UPI00064E5F9F|nr:phosphoglucosamine mutase [Pyrolobus fumarii]
MGRLFGTDGVRGVVNRELTVELALKLGLAIGTWFGTGSRILVGRDVRVGGDALMHAVIAGLEAVGCKVYVAGLAPTPAIQYAVRKHGFDGGVIVTASHNPPEYNGVKVVGSDGVEIPREAEREIEEIFFGSRWRYASWKSFVWEAKPWPNVIEDYVDAVASMVDDEAIRRRGFRVVVDAANSVGTLATPRVLQKLGVKVYTVNSDLNPLFPGREPEPTPDTLRETRRIVAELNTDLGVGHDGDADRAIIIDEKGEAWWGDRTGALLAAHVSERHPELPKRVFTGVSSSTLVEEYLSRFNIEVRWTPVGSVVISRMLIREGGIAGFEENGGYMHPLHQPVRDGAMTTALFLELMAHEGVKASELFDRLPKYYAVKTKVPMPREKAVEVVNEVKKHFSGQRMVTIDGVKVFGDGWWFLVRPSGTEPVLRIMVEARSPEEAKRLAEELKKLVEEIARSKA